MRLDVRPFGEDKIDEALRQVNGFPQQLIRVLLAQRPDLVPLARTPFYLGLIAEFGRRQLRLPNSQIELFEAYILNRLGIEASNIDKISDPNVSLTIQNAEDIANFLLTSQYGLDAPLDILKSKFPKIDVASLVQCLADARILRQGRSSAQKCSFAHRRVQEYFVVRYRTRMGLQFNHEWVALDSTMRDAAVLYVEVAGDDEAETIARRCWQDIRSAPPNKIDYSSSEFWRALHSQRFLVEAFRARPSALGSFRSEMSDRALSVLKNSQWGTEFSELCARDSLQEGRRIRSCYECSACDP